MKGTTRIEKVRIEGHFSIVYTCNSLNMASTTEYKKMLLAQGNLSVYQHIMLFDAFESRRDLIYLLCF